MKEKKEKEKKEVKPLNEVDYTARIDEIVDHMTEIEQHRDVIKENIKHLVNEYGLKASAVRGAATVIFKRNKEEFKAKSEKIVELVEKYNG